MRNVDRVPLAIALLRLCEDENELTEAGAVLKSVDSWETNVKSVQKVLNIIRKYKFDTKVLAAVRTLLGMLQQLDSEVSADIKDALTEKIVTLS